MDVAFFHNGRSAYRPEDAGPHDADAGIEQDGLFDDAELSANSLAATLAIAADKIAQFRRLLANEGCRLDAQRLIHDPVYAYKQLANAHCSEDPVLRKLSVELFEHYEYLELRRRLEVRHDSGASSRH